MTVFFLQRLIWLQRLSRAIRYPFKHQYRWWYSVELARRFVIVLMVVPFPRNNVSQKYLMALKLTHCNLSLQYPSLFFQCIFMVIFLYTQPYISTVANVAEAILSISTTIMLLVSVCPIGVRFILLESTTILLDDANSTCSNENSILTINTCILAVLFYFPLAVTAFFVIRSLVKLLR